MTDFADVFTVIRSESPIAKRFTLDGNVVRKTAAAQLTRGIARMVRVPTHESLRDLLDDVSRRHDTVIVPCAFLGAEIDEPFDIIDEQSLARALNLNVGAAELAGLHRIDGRSRRVAARLRRSVVPSAWMLLDADDPPGMPDEMKRLNVRERIALLAALFPSVATARRVLARSSSSRVLRDGVPVSRGVHAWVRIGDPDDIERARAAATYGALIHNAGFMSPRYSRTTPGLVIGHAPRSVFDFSVWTPGRIVFVAQPIIEGDGLTLADPRIVVEGSEGAIVDTHECPTPTAADLQRIKRKWHLDVAINVVEGGRVTLADSSSLTLDTELEDPAGRVFTVAQWLRDNPERDAKTRIQTPFRASTSVAAFITRHGQNVIVHDVGTGVTYTMKEPARAFDREELNAMVIAPDEDGVTAERFSSDHLGEIIFAAHRKEIRYCDGIGWLAWDGKRWQRNEDAVRALAHARAARLADTASMALKNSAPLGRKICSAGFVSAALSRAQSFADLRVNPDDLDADPWALNTPIGIVDMRTGEIGPHDPAKLCTRITNASPAGIGDRDEWLHFMRQITLGDESMIEFLRQSMGYCLTGDTAIQALYFWFGPSASNGKNTLSELLIWIMGDYAAKLDTRALMANKNDRHPEELAGLHGRRLAVSSEANDGDRWNEALIKELTGDVFITARFMRMNSFTFTRTHKHLIYGNGRPMFGGDDAGLRRRIKAVPFEARFVANEDGDELPEGTFTRDPAIAGRLRALSGRVLAWLIEGAATLYRNGLNLPACARVDAQTADYADAMDTFGQWITERIIRVPSDITVYERSRALYQDFANWKRDRGEGAMSETRFGEAMKRAGFHKRRSAKGIEWVGVKLVRTPPEDVDREAARVREEARSRL